MTVVNPPSWLQAGIYNARADRLATGGLFIEPGVTSQTGLQVTQTLTPSMSVIVTQGTCYIKNTYGAYQGYYNVTNDANVTITLDSSHPNFSRIDLIIAKVYDGSYAGSANFAAIEKLTGDPAPSPSPKPLPDNSIILAAITVPALSSSVTNSRISTSLRQTARLEPTLTDAVRSVTSNERPLSPYIGQKIFETDTEAERIFTGSTWRVSSPSTALPVQSTSKPSGVKAWTGMTVIEQDTKRIYMYDGSKWNYAGGGNGEILTTTFRDWNSGYKQIGGGYTTAYNPLTLWRGADGRCYLNGTVTNTQAITSWLQYQSYGITYLPTAYIPATDFLLRSILIVHGVGNYDINVTVKGSNPSSPMPGAPGLISWQANTSQNVINVAANNISIHVPVFSWPSPN